MSTMAYFLAKHPDWQERCRAESAGIGRRELNYADLESLVSLDLVMKESMRLVSPVPALARMAVKDTELRGHFVPAGTLVSVSVQLTHLLPSIWDKPEVFDPERFAAPRREDQRHRYAYLPFGGGVHKCMYFGGMEVKSVLHQMLLDCRWSVPPAYVMPLDRRSLPKPKDGLPLRLRSL